QRAGGVRPAAPAHGSARRPATVTGEDLHDPRHGVGSVEHAGRAPHHLDSLHVVGGEICEVVGPARRILWHTVDQHLHVVALPSAKKQRGLAPVRIRGDHVRAGNGSQCLGHRADAALAQLRAEGRLTAGWHRDNLQYAIDKNGPADTTTFPFSSSEWITRTGVDARLNLRPVASAIVTVGGAFEREAMSGTTLDTSRSRNDGAAYLQIVTAPERLVSVAAGARLEANQRL